MSCLLPFLRTFRLRLSPRKCQVFPVTNGIPFLGGIVFPGYRRLAKSGIRRFRNRVRQQQLEWSLGYIGLNDVRCSLVAWLGHARNHARPEFLSDLMSDTRFARNSADSQSKLA